MLLVGVVVTAAVSALKRAASFIASTDEVDSPSSSPSSTSHDGDKVIVLRCQNDGGGGREEGVGFESRSIIRRTILPLARSISRRLFLPFGLLDDSTWTAIYLFSIYVLLDDEYKQGYRKLLLLVGLLLHLF